MPEIVICSNHEELSLKAARLFADAARSALEGGERFTACFSGGNTPQRTYSLLAEEPFRSEIAWSRTHIFWGDERCIPIDQPDNHYRMTMDRLLGKVPIPPENIHRMRGEHPVPQTAADEYQEVLREFFDLTEGKFPRFDLVFLGMGDDGHTASLYPGTQGLAEMHRLVVAHYVPQRSMHRLTLTFPVFNAARQVVFLVAGQAKTDALKEVLNPTCNRDPAPPAHFIKPGDGKVLWLVDEEAARNGISMRR